MKKAFFLLLLIASPAFAEDVYSKFDAKTIILTKTVNEKIDVDAVKSNRQSLQASCDAQLAEYDAVLAEAQKAGVE